jgi:hypothetical protein
MSLAFLLVAVPRARSMSVNAAPFASATKDFTDVTIQVICCSWERR